MTFHQLYKKDECNMFYEIIYCGEEILRQDDDRDRSVKTAFQLNLLKNQVIKIKQLQKNNCFIKRGTLVR
jgi:hypothetical protein